MDGRVDHAFEAFDCDQDASTGRRMHLIQLEVDDNGQAYEEVEKRKRRIRKRNVRTPDSLPKNSANKMYDDDKTLPKDDDKSILNDSKEHDSKEGDIDESTNLPQSSSSDIDYKNQPPSRLVFGAIDPIWNSDDDGDAKGNLTNSPQTVGYDYTSCLVLGNNARLRMMIDLLQGADETIEKTFMCYKGGLVGVHHRPPLVFVVITSKAIYLCDHVHESHLFSLELRINLEDIKDIVIETGFQGLTIKQNKSPCMKICTASQELTEAILEELESIVLMKNCSRYEIIDESVDVTLLKTSLSSVSDEIDISNVTIEHFSLVYFIRSTCESDLDASSILNSSEFMTNFDQGTFGFIEGMLMYRLIRSDEDNLPAWTAGYFVLSNGYIYCYSDADKRSLIFFSQLFNDGCKGCRRLNDETITRPHVVEVKLVVDNVIQILHLATSSESDTTDWILNLFAGIVKDTPDQVGRFDGKNCLDKFCYLALTNDELYTLVRDVNTQLFCVLEKVSICDIVSAMLSSNDGNSSFCFVTLELESSSNAQDWTLYFCSPRSRKAFMDKLSNIWQQLFQVPFQMMQDDFSETPDRKQVLERLITWHKNATSALTD